MDGLDKIFSQDYDTFYEDWDDGSYVLDSDMPIKSLGNIKIWELAGCLLISAMSLVLIIFLLIKFSRRISLGKDDLEDLENLFKYSKTSKSLNETDRKIFHITKQVCFLTNEVNKSKKIALEFSQKKEILLKPEAKVILDKELVQNPDSFA